MLRFIGGAVSALVVAALGLFIWQAQADKSSPIPAVPAVVAQADDVELAPPPAADEKTKEQKRFARYDKDKNGIIVRAEYLANRQKAFGKLDTNGDGRLSFDEYAVKASQKFAAADRDRNGQLSAGEFATTRVIRKSKARPKCEPVRPPQQPGGDEEA